MKRWIVGAGVTLALLGAAYHFWGGRLWRSGPVAPLYRFARVERGDVVATVRATGIVQPIKVVQVGTQASGPIQKLYVDFNDRVKAGDLVAQIDPIVYEARLAQDKANLGQSMAAVEQAQAKLVQAERELERARQLAKREMLSQAELDAAVANRDTLAAQVKVAQAAVDQSQATLRLSTANLGYTTIRSPVNGVVIARNVSEGQTVVASMSAQVLFQIATDLQQVQVEASIPEADIGRVRPDQRVSFTVDAYEQEFTGTVAQVRLAAATVQSVVTYPVIIRAENNDGRLFPGMTANIVCEVARHENVLKIPNAALRYKPAESGAPAAAPRGLPERKPDRKPGAGAGPARGGGSRVWIAGPGAEPPRPVHVRLGISDGTCTELCEPAELVEGQEVIAGTAEKGATQTAVVNPFAPKFPGGGGGSRRPH